MIAYSSWGRKMLEMTERLHFCREIYLTFVEILEALQCNYPGTQFYYYQEWGNDSLKTKFSGSLVLRGVEKGTFHVALVIKNLPTNEGDVGLISRLGRQISWRRAWLSTPVFLFGEPHGQRSLVGYIYRVTHIWTRLKQLSMHGGERSHWFVEIKKSFSVCEVDYEGREGFL